MIDGEEAVMSSSKPMAPEVVAEFAEMLHGRRSEIAPPPARSSKYDLWLILHEREVSQIDRALARIRLGSYGVCIGCGDAVQFLELYLDPTSECCLQCRKSGMLVPRAARDSA
jgi:DnaK suppressor protein